MGEKPGKIDEELAAVEKGYRQKKIDRYLFLKGASRAADEMAFDEYPNKPLWLTINQNGQSVTVDVSKQMGFLVGCMAQRAGQDLKDMGMTGFEHSLDAFVNLKFPPRHGKKQEF